MEVELDDQANIIDTQCDCPYDMGDYCKHQVATFLAVRDIKKNLSKGYNQISQDSGDLESVLKSPVPKKRKAPNIEKILSDRTKEELVEFLLDIVTEYEEIKRRIELNFDDGNDEAELSKAIALIRTYINNKSDRHGFVAYGDTGEAVRGADLVLEKAHFALEKNKTVHALQLSLCVIQEMMDLLQGADDSDGVIGGVIEESLALIDEMCGDKELKPIHKEPLFNKLIEEASHRQYNGWTDWRIDLLESCSELADTSDLRSKLENYLILMLESEKGDSWGVNYLAERVNLIRYHLVEKHDGPKKAQEFIENNLQYSNFREMAIKSAMNKKDYDYVIKLTLDGEDKDKSLRGLVSQWKKYRHEAFKLSGKLDEQRGMATDFILDGSFDYYKELKNTYATNEWPSVYPKIIFLLENQKKTYQDVYTRILIEEGEKQKLLKYVQGSPSSVETYYRHLIPEFKEEVYLLFLQHIEQSAARAGNRKDYQRVCAIIRNHKKAGGKERVSEIIQKLINKYANRPAFRDELSRV
ncbi:SWIM zinc finger family protein [Desulfosporosinus fructosivorans]|uniref:SWIM zinc finger family protein n=1 Tax=Desulfosporosinus fructosivorans TaxID=2018669 RepID=UPI001FB10EBB|nr:SWIM zinc finger family protein [Desulfosporosinus fructosivorans]